MLCRPSQKPSPTPISATHSWSERPDGRRSFHLSYAPSSKERQEEMLYRVRHQTIYDYVEPVSVSHHVVRLTPRDLRGQKRRSMELSVWPVPPSHATTHIDYFGNTVTAFTLPESHTR